MRARLCRKLTWNAAQKVHKYPDPNLQLRKKARMRSDRPRMTALKTTASRIVMDSATAADTRRKILRATPSTMIAHARS